MPAVAALGSLLVATVGCQSAPPEDPRAARAEAYERVGSWPDAAALWTEIYLAGGARDVEAGLSAARSSLLAGRPEEARARLVDLVGRWPQDARVLELFGEADMALGQTDDARTRFTAALEIDPDRPRSLARIGAIDVAAGRTVEGLAALERSVELDPSDVHAQLDVGSAAAELGRMDRAAVAFDVACASDLVEDDERMEAARRLGDDARVAPWLEPVVRRDPQRTEALWRLGAARRLGGSLGRGRELLGRAAESDPGNVDALVRYANALLEDGFADDAREVVEHAGSLNLTEAESSRIEELASALEGA
ncbi:MAG: tetratricopeptide repeat protein [Planctomycetota bacterium]